MSLSRHSPLFTLCLFSMTTYYELLTLLPGAVAEERMNAAIEKLRLLLEKYKATVEKHQLWERRKLAYPVGKERQGVYLISLFDMESTNIPALEREILLDKEFLRYQLVRAHRKTAKELEREARRVAEERMVGRTPETADGRDTTVKEAPKREVSKEELEEKLAEILTDDMV